MRKVGGPKGNEADLDGSAESEVESKFEVKIEMNGRVKGSRTTSGRKRRAQMPHNSMALSKESESPARGREERARREGEAGGRGSQRRRAEPGCFANEIRARGRSGRRKS